MKDDAGIRQRQGIARGDGPMESSDFGCKTIESMRGREMPGPKGATMDAGERAVGKPVKHSPGKMPAQAAPDHGPHRYG